MKAIPRSFLTSATLCVMAFLSANSALAQTRIWTAGTGSWSTAANWNPAMLPISAEDAEINNAGTAQLTASGSVRDLYIGFGNLEISGSGSLTSRHGFVGNGPGAIGSASLSGGSAKWNTIGNNLIVGNLGHATLNVLGGADVTSGAGIVAQQAGSTGEATINGAGSTWTSNNDISVGKLGSGELNIELGAVVKSRDLLIATDIGSDGLVNISGTGSAWMQNTSVGSSGQVEVGVFGDGELTVSAAGSLSTVGESSIARQADSTGIVNVAGTGSLWTMSTSSATAILNIGYLGEGEMNVTAGGEVNSVDFCYLGREVGATGMLTFDGVGSKWTQGSNIYVGNSGTGTLAVKNGATVTVSVIAGRLAGSTGIVNLTDSGSQLTGIGIVGDAGEGTVDITNGAAAVASPTVGSQTGSIGTINVDGAGSVLTATSSTYIGQAGEGRLNIINIGKVVLQSGFGRLWIANMASGKGVVKVDGTGSELSCEADINVGVSGHGELQIKNGATVTSKYSRIGVTESSTGIVTISDGSTWTNDTDIVLGKGTLMISGASKLFTNGTNPIFGSTVGGVSGHLGAATVDGPGSEWISPTAGLYVGNVGGTGTLDITNGGKVANGEAILGRSDPLSHGTVNVNASTWNNSGRLDVGLVGTGIVNVSSAGMLTSNSARIGGQATGIGEVHIGTGSTWNNTGTLQVAINGTGLLEILGTVTSGGDATIGTKGTLKGTGTLNSNVTNNGIVAPGTSPGTLNIGGNFFQSSGKLQIEIASTTSFDKLIVSGQASMFGKLEIILLGGFIPSAADSFAILAAGSMGGGSFSEVTVTANSVHAGTFNVGFGAGGITLSNFAPAFIPGDFDSDGDVDGADFVAWQTHFPTASGAVLADGDADADGDVDGADFVVWQTNFPFTPGPGVAPVPEPGSWLLLATASVLLWSRRRGRMT